LLAGNWENAGNWDHGDLGSNGFAQYLRLGADDSAMRSSKQCPKQGSGKFGAAYLNVEHATGAIYFLCWLAT